MASTIHPEVNSFRDLIVWQKGMELICVVYAESAKLPPEERFGLIAQLRRSAISVPSNIAEGWGRHFGADYVRHLQIARGSAFELSTQSEICLRLNYAGDWKRIMLLCDEIGRILNGLITSVNRNLVARDSVNSNP